VENCVIDRTNELIKDLDELLVKYCKDRTTKIDFNKVIGHFEYFIKVSFVKRCLNIARASRDLGINRTTLAMYLKSIGLSKAYIYDNIDNEENLKWNNY
jgi:hypothetical protein